MHRLLLWIEHEFWHIRENECSALAPSLRKNDDWSLPHKRKVRIANAGLLLR
jgi:hypothetical protein